MAIFRFSVLGLALSFLGISNGRAQVGPALKSTPSATFKTSTNIAYGTDPAQQMDVYVPTKTGLKPAIVMMHAGGWIGGKRSGLNSIAQYFAKNGYVVANIDYRLATPTQNHYPASPDDAAQAVAFLRANSTKYQVDSTWVAAFGVSAGAYLAVELANAGTVQAAVDFYGPVDLTDPSYLGDMFGTIPNSQIAAEFIGDTIVDNLPVYTQASPLKFVSAVTAPMLILHGELDVAVPVMQSEDLYSALQSFGVNSQLILVPNLGHNFLTTPGVSNTVYLQDSLTFLNGIFAAKPKP